MGKADSTPPPINPCVGKKSTVPVKWCHVAHGSSCVVQIHTRTFICRGSTEIGKCGPTIRGIDAGSSPACGYPVASAPDSVSGEGGCDPFAGATSLRSGREKQGRNRVAGSNTARSWEERLRRFFCER